MAILEEIQTYSTAAAALFAAASAGIAVWAMKVNMASSKILLAETQITNSRQGFEQRYTLLLTQHNALHDALCKYLNKEPTVKNAYGYEYALSTVNSEQTGLDRYFYFLTGHPVISPYMRILFHLLKHINDDPYMSDKTDTEKRLYSSPLRSYIRNDVLFLIAINALNVKSDRLKGAGYPKYQKLLHRFNFFEHAVFTNPQQPNEPFVKRQEWIKSSIDKNNHAVVEREYFFQELRDAWANVMGCFLKHVKHGKLPGYLNMAFDNNIVEDPRVMFPNDLLSTPLLACTAVYRNPHSDGLCKAISDYVEAVYVRCKLEYRQSRERYDKAQLLLRFINGTFTDPNGIQRTITVIGDLTSLASDISIYNRSKAVLRVSGGESDESVTLLEIIDELKVLAEYESTTWPQDESHFYFLLKKRIHTVINDAYGSFVSSLRYQFEP